MSGQTWAAANIGVQFYDHYQICTPSTALISATLIFASYTHAADKAVQQARMPTRWSNCIARATGPRSPGPSKSA